MEKLWSTVQPFSITRVSTALVEMLMNHILISVTNVLKNCLVIITLVRKMDNYFMLSIKVIFNTNPSFCTAQFDWNMVIMTSFFIGLSVPMPSSLGWLWRNSYGKRRNVCSSDLIFAHQGEGRFLMIIYF